LSSFFGSTIYTARGVKYRVLPEYILQAGDGPGLEDNHEFHIAYRRYGKENGDDDLPELSPSERSDPANRPVV